MRPVDGIVRPRSGGVCIVALSVLCLCNTALAQESSADDVRMQIESLRMEQERISQMQSELAARIQSLEANLSAGAALAVSAAPASIAASAPPPSRLSVSGDFRLRGQGDYSDGATPDRNSAQVRGRFGATFAVTNRVSVGARIVTGDADDPNSTDVQLSNFDDDLDAALDLAYVQLNFDHLKLSGGKVPQPFTRTDLVWDGDVNPQGISASYKRPLGSASFRANGLYFLIDEQVAGPESTMRGLQLGLDSPALGHWKHEISAAYYDYRLGSTAGGDAGDFRSNPRNPDGSYVSDFDLVDVVASTSWSGLGDRWPVRVVADYVKNTAAATDEDVGYGVEVTVGRFSSPGDWRVTYGHAVAETDSVFAAFSHDNLGIATNYKLDALTLDYLPFDKTTLSAIWYHYAPYSVAAGVSDESRDRLRLFMQVNF
jgi:hypothetical protein